MPSLPPSDPSLIRGWLEAIGPELAERVREDVSLRPLTTLRVGGPAERYLRVETEHELATAAAAAQRIGVSCFVLAGGSNLCISDRGIRGIVIHNAAQACSIGPVTYAAAGHGLILLSLKALEAGLAGLAFAIGIPGSVGGALVSNAGAYRHSIGPLVRRVLVTHAGETGWVGPDWMQFGYRDSRLRHSGAPAGCLVAVELGLEPGCADTIRSEARRYQHNRIWRQPWAPSAGSFFKNVYDAELAQRVPDLPDDLRKAGVVPAGYLSQACGCRGLRCGDAQISPRHGNFIVNTGQATASDVRNLAEEVKRRVMERFGVALEEEVIYAGDWEQWTAAA